MEVQPLENSLKMIFGLVGGLGLFLYGIELMADGLQKVAGDRLRRLLDVLTGSPLAAVLAGAVVTILVQSSSATSVMVVGFVNAGLMSLQQAISVIMGAAIGTTATAFLVSLRLTDLALPAIGIGFLLTVAVSKKRTRFMGQALLGFGLLFLGLNTMGDAMLPLRSSPLFIGIMLNFSKQPLLGALAGAIFTAIVQSSSATTGLVVTLAAADLLNLDAAFSLILGANIGTTVTALIASANMQLTAKRTALAQLLFRTAGVALFLIVFRPFLALVALTTPLVARQAANAHIFFNIFNVIVMLPFLPLYVRLVERILPGEDTTEQFGAVYLDENLLNTPSIALGQATKELIRMGDLTVDMLDKALDAFKNSNPSNLAPIARREDAIDQLEHDMVDYLVRLSQASLTNEQSARLNSLLHVSSDFERIGDHSQNIADLADYRIEHRLPFSKQAEDELADISGQVRNLVQSSIDLLSSNAVADAKKIMASEGSIDLLEKSLRRQHIRRLNKGVCFPTSGIVYLDLISNLERIADHAENIAEALVGAQTL